MATLLTTDDLSPATLIRLQQTAAEHNSSVAAEAARVIERALVVEYVPAAPVLDEPVLSQEMSPPYDLELPGPRERVAVRDAGEPKLEFLFDEDGADQ